MNNDISELQQARQRAERLNGVLRAIRNVNQLITKEGDPQRLIDGACTNLTENLSYHNAWIALLDDNGALRSTAQSGLDGFFNALCERLQAGEFSDCMHHALGVDRVLVVKNPAEQCQDCPLASAYSGRAGLARRLAFAGRTYGILAVSVPAVHAHDTEELALFEELAGDLAFALHKIRMGRELDDSQRRYRQLFEGSRDGFVMVDAKGHFLDANQAYCDMLGYSRDELRAMENFYRITPARWREWEKTEIWEKRLLERGESGLYEKAYIRKDGTVFPVELQSYAVRNDAGEIEYLWGTARDITERKRAEEALRESEARFRSYIEQSPYGVFVADGQGRYVDVNPASERITGYSAEQLKAMRITDLIAPESRETAAKHFQRLTEIGEAATEVAFVRADGSVGHWTVAATRIGPDRYLGFVEEITARKKREERIALLGRMLDDAPAAITIHDTDGNFLFSNRQNMLLHGYDLEAEFFAMNLHDLDVPASEALLAERLQQIADHGEARFEVEHYRRDGSTFPLEVLAKRIEWEDQLAILSIAVDITERIKAQTKLRESEERFRSFFTNLCVGSCLDEIIYKDGRAVDYRVLDVNPAYETVMGIARDEAVGALGSQVYGLGEAPFLDRLKHVAETGEPERFEAFFEPIGKHLDFTVSRPSPGMFSTVFFDITERKRAEAEKAEGQALLEAIYRNAPLIMMVVNRERRIQQVNGFAAQFAHYSTEEMLGLRGGEALRCLHALDDPRGCGFGEFCEQCVIRNTVLDTLENGTTHRQVEADYYPEPANNRRSAMKLLVSTTPIEFKGERMALVTMQDVTERVSLEHQLSQSRKLESVGRLAGGVAHDFNNLLMGIMGYAEMCLEEIGDDHPITEWLEEIRNESQRSTNLTRQLLAFASRQTVAPKILDLNEQIEGMLKMLRRLIGEDIDLAWKACSGATPVKMDPGQVDQILANLCVNARDAIGGVGKVTIETDKVAIDAAYCAEHAETVQGAYIMLAVSDDGCGMDSGALEHIFEPFYTTKSTGEGTGLGLATIYGIVKQNDGFVNVYSEPGQGTTFRIYLPRFEGEPAEEKKEQSSGKLQGGGETILLAEDEGAIRDILGRLLGNLGYTVLEAESPEQALTLVNEHAGAIDLLLTDVVMPGMNGRDLAETVKEDYPDLKVIYMSGYTPNVIAHRGILDDGVEFLSKPISRDALTRKVREVLDR